MAKKRSIWVINKCLNCSKEIHLTLFRKNRGYGVYCSKKCQHSHSQKRFKGVFRSPRTITNCVVCNKEISLTPYEKSIGRGKYCSQACLGIDYKKRFIGRGANPGIEKVCPTCNKTFITKKHKKINHCSKKCGYKTISKKRDKRIEKMCPVCNKKFKHPRKQYRKFCSLKCRSKIYRGSNHPLWNGGTAFEPYPFGWNEELKNKIKALYDYKCQLCGASELEYLKTFSVHHIDYNKKNISLNNLIPLCERCHGKTTTNRKYWEKFFNERRNKSEAPSLIGA